MTQRKRSDPSSFEHMASPTSHALLNAAEVGLLLRRSRSWVYAHVDELPHLRLPGGGAPLFCRETVLAWARERIATPKSTHACEERECDRGTETASKTGD